MMDKYLVHQTNNESAGTHAIVIGAGTYKYLNGGTEDVTDFHGGMNQLSSPPISARNFATWLIEKFHHPGKPLSSVSLLLSENNPSKFENPDTKKFLDVEYPSLQNVKEALRAWKQRGETDDENLLIFYFCGHGLSRGRDTSLLLPDFGRESANVFEDAIDFKSFEGELKKCNPKHKIFFIDACRVGSDSIIEIHNALGDPIFQLPGYPINGNHSPVFYSTLDGEKAYGIKNSSSYFTETLLQALGGAAAHEDTNSNWRVTTTRMKETIDVFMDMAVRQGTYSRKQVPVNDGLSTFDFHFFEKVPEIPVHVCCNPLAAQELADLSCQSVDDKSIIIEREPNKKNEKPWQVPIKAGSYYEFKAEFTSDDYKEKSKRKAISGPYPYVKLEVNQ